MGVKKKCSVAMVALLALAPFSFARPDHPKAEEDRIRNADTVVKEILNVPDDIPQDLLDKARCVIVMPSVLKAGTPRRGVPTFKGRWRPSPCLALPLPQTLLPAQIRLQLPSDVPHGPSKYESEDVNGR